MLISAARMKVTSLKTAHSTEKRWEVKQAFLRAGVRIPRRQIFGSLWRKIREKQGKETCRKEGMKNCPTLCGVLEPFSSPLFSLIL